LGLAFLDEQENEFFGAFYGFGFSVTID